MHFICLTLEDSHSMNFRTPPEYNCYIQHHCPLCCIRLWMKMMHQAVCKMHKKSYPQILKPVRTPVAILGSLGVCIYGPASRHWLISYSPIHLT